VRSAGALVALACLLAACGGSHAAKPQKVPGEPGYWLKIHGHRMYYECAGHGSPAIVLEAGLGGDHRSWLFVQPDLAKTTRTCSYDRAGLGLSSADGLHRSGKDQVEDLHALLDAAGIAPPYVLVGHSYGGILVHEFASEHGTDVAGMVRVDSSHPLQAQRFLAALGSPRPGESRIRRELRSFLRHAPANVEDLDVRASFAEAGRAGPLGDKPLVVITAGQENDPSLPPQLKRLLDDTWLSLQDELTRLSSNSIHVIATQSMHAVMAPTGQPDLVVTAIREVVQKARATGRLPACSTVFRPPGARCLG
jgi:pimeloyl-ACP methyl ester carboxylesterase